MTVSTYPTDLVERLTRERDDLLKQVERLKDGYELGYREGGNSDRADWDLAFGELLDMEIDDLTAWQAVERVKVMLDQSKADSRGDSYDTDGG